MRQIVLDTETTGLDVNLGHRVIEIGCVELVERKFTKNNYHQYLNPERQIDEGAMEVHGITNEFLDDKPLFADVAGTLFEYLEGAELIIHNARFDVGFLNKEFRLLDKKYPPLEKVCKVTDTVAMARKKHPGQKNNLDALCRRYGVDNSQRELHGALLDAEILADVYLMMTGGQTALLLGGQTSSAETMSGALEIQPVEQAKSERKVLKATAEEMTSHQDMLKRIEKQGGKCVWLEVDG